MLVVFCVRIGRRMWTPDAKKVALAGGGDEMKALRMRVRGGERGILGPRQPWVVFINSVLYEQTEFDTRPPPRLGSSSSMPMPDAKGFASTAIPSFGRAGSPASK